MNNREHGNLIQYVLGLWPHSPLNEQSFVVWREELEDVPYEVALTAVKVMGRTGQRHAPSPGEVRRKAVELMVDAPAWSVALPWIRRWFKQWALGTRGKWERHAETAARMKEQEPVLARFVDALGTRQIEDNLVDGNGEARLRNKYEDYVRDLVESQVLAGLSAPPGMLRIERANRQVLPIGDAVRVALEAARA